MNVSKYVASRMGSALIGLIVSFLRRLEKSPSYIWRDGKIALISPTPPRQTRECFSQCGNGLREKHSLVHK
jgi:hypothetical protein